MSNFRIPPELADGGYWYVVEAIMDETVGGWSPGDVPSDYCVWYRYINGTKYAAVRFREPVLIPSSVDIPVSAIVKNFKNKPYGRIEGK